MKMQRCSLSILFALGAAILTGCEDKEPPHGVASPGPEKTDSAPDSAAGNNHSASVRYPEFERQERVERIAALATVPGEGGEGFKVCTTCHGAEGLGSRDGVIPRLAGQQEKVLIEKLVEISDGVRHRPEMEPWLSYIDTDDEISALAAYISALPDPAQSGRGTGQALVLGKNIFEQYCISCHGRAGEGDGDARVPRIAGWDFASVRRTLILQGVDRSEVHETGMSDLVSMLTEDEIDALADYVSGLVLNPDPEMAPHE